MIDEYTRHKYMQLAMVATVNWLIYYNLDIPRCSHDDEIYALISSGGSYFAYDFPTLDRGLSPISSGGLHFTYNRRSYPAVDSPFEMWIYDSDLRAV